LHPHSKKKKDSIAQLVEHITFNDGVLGSSPSRVTIFLFSYAIDSIAQLVEHITFNDGVLGSSPSRVTIFLFSYAIDSIAQLVEHITFNDGVLGSSPSRVTKSCSLRRMTFFVLGHVEKLVDLPS
jgi:hypothetical protein